MKELASDFKTVMANSVAGILAREKIKRIEAEKTAITAQRHMKMIQQQSVLQEFFYCHYQEYAQLVFNIVQNNYQALGLQYPRNLDACMLPQNIAVGFFNEQLAFQLYFNRSVLCGSGRNGLTYFGSDSLSEISERMQRCINLKGLHHIQIQEAEDVGAGYIRFLFTIQ